MKPLALLQGCGVSAFVLFRLYVSPISHPSDLRMHTPVPLTNFALSILANLVLTGIVFAFLGQWIGSSRKLKWMRFALPGILLALLVKVVGFNVNAEVRPVLLFAIFLGVTFLAVVLHRKSPRGEQIVANLTRAVLLGMGIFFFIVTLQLARLAMWRPYPNYVDNLPPARSASDNHPRVVWILFDELSYQQVFGDRFPNLQLPNFDALRQSSTVFTQARPVADYTELAIPSILLGKIIQRVSFTSDDRLNVGAATGPFYPFDAAQTPFARARKDGLTTGVVGWYNPYCSSLSPYLNLCFRDGTNEEDIPQEYGVHDGFRKDFTVPWVHYFVDASHSKRKHWLIVRHAETDQELLRESEHALEQPNLDFLLIHLPIPHPPGIYNRATQQFDASGNRSYIDNLALADTALGQLMAILQRSPRWNNTDVIVCGDHSWRTWHWAPRPTWTKEDAAASHGGIYDARPMLMIHLAGQTTSATVNTPYSLLGVRDVLNALADGKSPSYSYRSRASTDRQAMHRQARDR